jgi:hypothetical protein
VVLPKGGPGFEPEPKVKFTTGSPRLPWHNWAEVVEKKISNKNEKATNVFKYCFFIISLEFYTWLELSTIRFARERMDI